MQPTPHLFKELSWHDRSRAIPTHARWATVLLLAVPVLLLGAGGLCDLLVNYRAAWGIRDQSWLVPALNEAAQALGRDLLPVHWCLFCLVPLFAWICLVQAFLVPLSPVHAQEVWRLTRTSTACRLVCEEIIKRRGTLTKGDLGALRDLFLEDQKRNSAMKAHQHRRWDQLHRKNTA